MMTQEQIEQAYIALKSATQAYWTVKLQLMRDQQDYERILGTGLLNGTIVGKNETERLGSMYHEYSSLVEAYLDSKEKEAQAKMNLELAKLEVEQIQTSLTYLQMMK